ncbi:MAG: MBL fold metallo-hydrolase [Chloroflexota bacterium]|nr:MBL fold metallo-hydrolase [Chloroflexota bacterium]
MNIRILGAHNSETQASRCISLLIDDSLVIDAGGLTSALSMADQKKIKAILLTHQHYDHIRDVPAIALNLNLQGGSIDIYSTPEVRAAIETHLLNGVVYPRFQELPRGKPTVSFNPIAPGTRERIDGHEILAMQVKHRDTTLGYLVSDAAGKSMFYTADTGPGLQDCWEYMSPQLLIIDVTVPNTYEEFALTTGHLTPRLLNSELVRFREDKGYLPRIVVIHMDPTLESEIREEVAAVAESLETPITIAHEGMEINI